MTPQPPLDVKSIFGRALELNDPGRRAAYLAEACAEAPAVRAEVEELLGMHDRASGFLRRPAGAAADLTAPYQPLSEQPGTRVGPYKLLQQIGEGGMGTVFMAEQEEPVRRTVAVKIIKPGMDSKQVVARFEAERQALAMMDHTNIARVLDAGTTDTGRPYFVMELVHGVPIVEYCDANKLTPRQRLELFVPVCQAIQHAHMKGIIHRDVKPSNVLVTMYDDKPVPKVIDFGVAKAVEQKLTEKTLFTQYGALVGTFEYMSPEQAEMNAFGVDTRSDVYSLGVLLYELLTGTTPLERARLRQAAYGEIVRLIKEEEPPRPSVRLSASGTLAKVAEARKTEPAKLSSLVRGELDWIVMKCLEKDRTRRYETATGLAKDVQRHLAGDAVEACPPTLGYRLRKAYRRNQAAVSVGGMIAGVLLLATGVSLAFGIQSRQAERRAVQQELVAQENAREAAKSAADARSAAGDREAAINHLGGVLARFNPYRHPDGTGNPSIKDVLDEACKSLEEGDGRRLSPVVRVKVRSVFGRMYMDVHEYEKGHSQLKKAYEELMALNGPDDGDALKALESYAAALLESRLSTEDVEKAEEKLREVYDTRVRTQGAGHSDAIQTFAIPLRTALFLQGKLGEIERMGDQALRAALASPEMGENHPLTAQLQLRISSAVAQSGDPDRIRRARELCLRAKETFTRRYGPEARQTLTAEVILAGIWDKNTDLSERAREVAGIKARMIETCKSEQDPFVLASMDAYLLACWFAGDYEAAGEPSKKYLGLATQVYGPRHPNTRHAIILRAEFCFRLGDFAEAQRLRNEAETNFKHLDNLAGGYEDFEVMPLNVLAAKCILHGNNTTEADFEKAKRHLETADGLLRNQKFTLGDSVKRGTTVHRTRQVEVWIELYEKWKLPGYEDKIRQYREELKQLKS
jgi:serine/threonine protein kinase